MYYIDSSILSQNHTLLKIDLKLTSHCQLLQFDPFHWSQLSFGIRLVAEKAGHIFYNVIFFSDIEFEETSVLPEQVVTKLEELEGRVSITVTPKRKKNLSKMRKKKCDDESEDTTSVKCPWCPNTYRLVQCNGGKK